MAPLEADELAAAFAERARVTEARHEANLERFGRIEQTAAELKGSMRIIIALLAANGVLNVIALIPRH